MMQISRSHHESHELRMARTRADALVKEELSQLPEMNLKRRSSFDLEVARECSRYADIPYIKDVLGRNLGESGKDPFPLWREALAEEIVPALSRNGDTVRCNALMHVSSALMQFGVLLFVHNVDESAVFQAACDLNDACKRYWEAIVEAKRCG